jgi:hypothetical protein
LKRPKVEKAAESGRVWAPVPDKASGGKDPLYVATLEANRQIASSSDKEEPGTTHAIERDAEGHRRLVRKRFSAV